MGIVSSVKCQRKIKMPVESDPHRYRNPDKDTWIPSLLITDRMNLRGTLCSEACGHFFLDRTFQS